MVRLESFHPKSNARVASLDITLHQGNTFFIFDFENFNHRNFFVVYTAFLVLFVY